MKQLLISLVDTLFNQAEGGAYLIGDALIFGLHHSPQPESQKAGSAYNE